MLEDALEGDCFFAVGRLLSADSGDPADRVAKVGTIGLVRVSRESEDGTSQLLLHGVMRVRFTKWHDDRDYPYASIEPVISVSRPLPHHDQRLRGPLRLLRAGRRETRLNREARKRGLSLAGTIS